MNSIRVLTAILVFVTSCVCCLAEAANEASADAESAHSVAKREARLQTRSAAWWPESSSADDESDDGGADSQEGGFEKRRIPRFIGKRGGLFVSEPDSGPLFEELKRGRPRFIGKREDEDSVVDDGDKRGRPVFIGRRSDCKDKSPERYFLDTLMAKRGRPRFIGKRSMEKRGRPRFIGRRSSNDAALADLISRLSRNAELELARQRIENAKRRYAPRFIGKRSEEQDGADERLR